MQSFVPVLAGGISDRVGYKETIFASTVIKILGYLIMAWFATYWGFMVGALVLAFGTGIFKPGIQATIVKSTNRQNSSMAWGVFYQTVNIGGFLGPLVAAQLRQLDWAYVFYACAAIISLNFLLLLTYKEQDKEARLEHRRKVEDIIDLLEIAQYRDERISDLSYGARKYVELARALCAEPTLLLLDEPASGLNNEETDDVSFWLEDIKHDLGVTLVMVEHDMNLVGTVADRVMAINNGKLIAIGTPDEIREHPEVQQAYLGVAA